MSELSSSPATASLEGPPLVAELDPIREPFLANVTYARPRVALEIDLAAIRANFRAVAARVAPLSVMVVLKANAYGLGLPQIARCLREAGAAAIGVAELREALAIRDLGLPVQILGSLIDEEVPAVVANNLIAPLTDHEIARQLSAEAIRQGRQVECHFKIDTGMGRLGLRFEDAEEVITRVWRLPGLRCTGIYSHFPSANCDYPYSEQQVRDFRGLLERLARRDITFRQIHIANSDGINNIPSSIKWPFTMARTGINLYGVYDMEGQKTMDLRPALTLKTRLVATRCLPPGSLIGYSGTHQLDRPLRVGTIPIGYADGLPLAMSNTGKVLLRGRECAILGRISMDYTTIDIEGVPTAKLGDEVICLGGSITVDDWAKSKQTHPYEVICSFGNRVARRYVDSDSV